MSCTESKPLISVIVPIYKVEQYLKVCVESLRRQTYPNLEIILVNDGSPDGCGAMCDRYQQLDDRIVVVHKPNGGLSDARNAGLDVCKGEFIAFVDSDDMVHEQYIEGLINHIGHADFIYCDYRPFFKEEDIVVDKGLEHADVQSVSSGEAYRKLTNLEDALIVVSWNKLYRRFLWNNLRFKVGVLHEDEHVIHHLIHRSNKIAYLDHILVYYRQREESITSNKNDTRSFLDKQSGYYDRYCFFKEQKMNEEASAMLSFILYRCAMKTIEKENFVWNNVNSFNNILNAGLSFRLKLVLLLKKYMYTLYGALYDLKIKV